MNPIIQVTQLSKSYHGIPAVKDLNLTIQKGEVFGLLGANGSGKTTTIECIIGTKAPDRGEVSILDMDPKRDRKRLFEHVGVQFQEAIYQDKITVAELCEETQSLYKTGKDYENLLKDFHLTEKLGSPVTELSGGQKQRLFIVLALIPNPEVVFLDELTTGLDPKSRRDVWNYLTRLKKDGLTIFLTSHFMDEVAILCDNIGILKEGTLIFYGTVASAIEASPYDTLEDAYLWFTSEEEEYDESI